MSEREEIREDAKRILNSFSESLEKVKLRGNLTESREEGFRKEGDGGREDEDFRQRIFKNAPKIDGDFISAEKKIW